MIVHFVWQGAIKFSSNTGHYAGSAQFPSQISILHCTQSKGWNPASDDTLILRIQIKTMEENMALWSDPRFSDTEKRNQQQRIEDPFDKAGIGPGFMMFAGAAFGVVLLATLISLGHPERPTTLADRSLDQPIQSQPAHQGPQAPRE